MGKLMGELKQGELCARRYGAVLVYTDGLIAALSAARGVRACSGGKRPHRPLTAPFGEGQGTRRPASRSVDVGEVQGRGSGTGQALSSPSRAGGEEATCRSIRADDGRDSQLTTDRVANACERPAGSASFSGQLSTKETIHESPTLPTSSERPFANEAIDVLQGGDLGRPRSPCRCGSRTAPSAHQPGALVPPGGEKLGVMHAQYQVWHDTTGMASDGRSRGAKPKFDGLARCRSRFPTTAEADRALRRAVRGRAGADAR
jgi:hypothetical protein